LGLPAGVTLNPLSLAADKDTATAVLDVKTSVTPGPFTLIFRGQAGEGGGKGRRGGNNQGPFQPSNPVTINVLRKELAKLTLAPHVLTLAPGQEGTVKIRVARLSDFHGPFQIKLTPAPGDSLRIAEPEIAAESNETDLLVRAADDAASGISSTFVL